MFKATIFSVTILICGVSHAQQIAKAPNQPTLVAPVVNLGDVVVNVVVAKVLPVGSEFELSIAKFGGKEAIAATNKTTMVPVTTVKIVEVNGKKAEQVATSYSVVTEAVPKENFTPTEQNRTVNVRSVQAFDLRGNPVDRGAWTKFLETPRHVLLLKEPISETNKLNPFYAAILREDMLMLFLKSDPLKSSLENRPD